MYSTDFVFSYSRELLAEFKIVVRVDVVGVAVYIGVVSLIDVSAVV